MRFDTEIYMQQVSQPSYSAENGDYSDEIVNEDKLYADVTEVKTETINIVYGGIKEGVLVVRLQNHYDKPFDYIRIGEKRYKVDYSKTLRTKQAYIVSEVQ